MACGHRPSTGDTGTESASEEAESTSESETGETFDPSPWLGEWTSIGDEFPIGEEFKHPVVVGLSRATFSPDGTGTFETAECYSPPEDPPRTFRWVAAESEPRIDIFPSADGADFPFGLSTGDALEVWAEPSEPCGAMEIFKKTAEEERVLALTLDLHAAICIVKCENDDIYNELADCTANPTCE